MLFNSLQFAIFMAIVFVLYWFVAARNHKSQNLLILVSSYIFYACWDWHFLFLLIFSTALDYYTGIKIAETSSKSLKKVWLWSSIGINLGFLAVFKYYNFFSASFIDLGKHLGLQMHASTLDIILPVGISFYTFHGLSYVIDLYYDRIKPEKNLIDYSVFVSFFPLLVAGPIERASHLLPQVKQARVFNPGTAVDGLRQIFWGLFKKVVIADNCAALANHIFDSAQEQSGSTLVLGAIFFAFQIYGDFSGYSDIALGTARLMGFELLKNFAYPYFSRDIAEFWRRWHISLTTWFRDYLYIPLGGSKGGTWMKVRNTFIIFLVSGLWHGANWTFIIWGALNALYFLPLLLFNQNRNHLDVVAQGRKLPTLKELGLMTLTFALSTLAWIFFRSASVSEAFAYIQGICSPSLFTIPQFGKERMAVITLMLLSFFLVIEWNGREKPYAIAQLGLTWPKPLRWAFYYVLLFMIFVFVGPQQEFIYFQF